MRGIIGKPGRTSLQPGNACRIANRLYNRKLACASGKEKMDPVDIHPSILFVLRIGSCKGNSPLFNNLGDNGRNSFFYDNGGGLKISFALLWCYLGIRGCDLRRRSFTLFDYRSNAYDSKDGDRSK